MDNLKIFSMNVRGLRNDTKRQKVFQWLKNKDCSLYLIQETHSSPDINEKWKNEWHEASYFSGKIEYHNQKWAILYTD